MICPYCSADNPPLTEKCECGYKFKGYIESICPVCNADNPPLTEKCECGYIFLSKKGVQPNINYNLEWYFKVVGDNYANFNGRASRQEYWMFFLFSMIFSIVVMVADNILGTNITVGEGYYEINMYYGWILILFALALLTPSVAIFVRRMHDIGKSGWWYLILLIPLVGGIWGLILLCTDSNPHDNNYGPSSKVV